MLSNSIKRENVIGIFIAFLVFFAYSIFKLSRLGLSYDESIFVNAAIGGVTQDFIYKKIGSFPLMTFPYEGAIKSWIYYPIFKLFGVSLFSIRIPAIIISFVTIIVWFQNSKMLFRDSFFPILFMLLLATDPAFIYHTRIDYNTLILQSLFIALSFYAFWNWLRHQDIRYFLLFNCILFLGVYNRLNFYWFVFAFFGATFLTQFNAIRSAIQQKRKVTMAVTFGFAILLSAYFYFMAVPLFHFPMGDLMAMPLNVKIPYVMKLYSKTMSGSFPFIKIFHRDVGVMSFVNGLEWSVITLAGLSSIILYRFARWRQNITVQMLHQPFNFCLLVCLFLLIEVVMTPQARNSYHVMITWPLQHVLFLLGLVMLTSFFNERIKQITLFILISVIISSQLLVNNEYVSALSQPNARVDKEWTPAINRLSEYVNHEANTYDAIVSVEAVNNQLMAFAASDVVRLKLHQEAWALLTNDEHLKQMRNYVMPQFNQSDAANLQWLHETYFRNQRTLVITLIDGIYPPEINFYRFAEQYHLILNPVVDIPDENGQPMYSLLAVDSIRDVKTSS